MSASVKRVSPTQLRKVVRYLRERLHGFVDDVHAELDAADVLEREADRRTARRKARRTRQRGEMVKTKLTAKNACLVLGRVLMMPAGDRDEILKEWNEALDSLRAQDFFGTEGQLDPRGDGRNDD